MTRGRFLMDRGIFENPLWEDIVAFRLFFYLVGKACFQDGVSIGEVSLKKGQWVRSYRNLRNDLEYKENRTKKLYPLSAIERAVKRLVKDGRIKISECELGTLFEVVNYEAYQAFTGTENPASETEMKQGWDSVGTDLGQGWDNNNYSNHALKNQSNNPSDKPDLIFSPWKEYLDTSGQDSKKAGSFLGLLRKTYGDSLLAEAIMDTIGADPIGAGKNANGYLKTVLKTKAQKSESSLSPEDFPEFRGAK